MSISGVGSTAGLASVATSGNSPLDKNAFLKLLLAQLSNQDPMKPMEDKEFVSQLAQFSSLEQMQSMNQNLDKFLGAQMLTQATGWIGKAIQWHDSTSDKDVVGQVKSVAFEDGEPTLVVPMRVSVKGDDGKTTEEIQDFHVSMSSVLNVFSAEDTESVSSALGWIGKTVTGTELGGTKAITGTVTGVEFRNGITVLNMSVDGESKKVALGAVQAVAD